MSGVGEGCTDFIHIFSHNHLAARVIAHFLKVKLSWILNSEEPRNRLALERER